MRRPDSDPYFSASRAEDFKPTQAGSGMPNPSARLLVRLLAKADESAFVALARESFQFHQKWIKLPTDCNTFEQYLSRFDNESAFCFVVCENNSIVGFISLTGIEREPYQRARLGYGVFEQYAKAGYMSFGLKSVIQFAFENLGLHRLEADIQPDNEPSKRLVEKIGFTCEGISLGFIKINGKWEDHQRWKLTLEEWGKPGYGKHRWPELEITPAYRKPVGDM